MCVFNEDSETRNRPEKTEEYHSAGKEHQKHVAKRKLFADQSEWLKNNMLSKRKKTFKCSMCGKKFYSRRSFSVHMSYHTREAPCKCRVCGKDFRCEKDLYDHFALHLGGVERPADDVDVCGTEDEESDSSISNIEKNDSTISNIEDIESFIPCKEKSNLSDRNSANREKNDLSTSNQTLINLLLENRQHAGNQVPKENLSIVPLKQVYPPSEAKPYVCSLCGKGFKCRSNMRAHERLHEGLRPHVCSICGNDYKIKPHLQRHMRKTHGESSLGIYSQNKVSAPLPNPAHIRQLDMDRVYGQEVHSQPISVTPMDIVTENSPFTVFSQSHYVPEQPEQQHEHVAKEWVSTTQEVNGVKRNVIVIDDEEEMFDEPVTSAPMENSMSNLEQNAQNSTSASWSGFEEDRKDGTIFVMNNQFTKPSAVNQNGGDSVDETHSQVSTPAEPLGKERTLNSGGHIQIDDGIELDRVVRSMNENVPKSSAANLQVKAWLSELELAKRNIRTLDLASVLNKHMQEPKPKPTGTRVEENMEVDSSWVTCSKSLQNFNQQHLALQNTNAESNQDLNAKPFSATAHEKVQEHHGHSNYLQEQIQPEQAQQGSAAKDSNVPVVDEHTYAQPHESSPPENTHGQSGRYVVTTVTKVVDGVISRLFTGPKVTHDSGKEAKSQEAIGQQESENALQQLQQAVNVIPHHQPGNALYPHKETVNAFQYQLERGNALQHHQESGNAFQHQPERGNTPQRNQILVHALQHHLVGNAPQQHEETVNAFKHQLVGNAAQHHQVPVNAFQHQPVGNATQHHQVPGNAFQQQPIGNATQHHQKTVNAFQHQSVGNAPQHHQVPGNAFQHQPVGIAAQHQQQSGNAFQHQPLGNATQHHQKPMNAFQHQPVGNAAQHHQNSVDAFQLQIGGNAPQHHKETLNAVHQKQVGNAMELHQEAIYAFLNQHDAGSALQHHQQHVQDPHPATSSAQPQPIIIRPQENLPEYTGYQPQPTQQVAPPVSVKVEQQPLESYGNGQVHGNGHVHGNGQVHGNDQVYGQGGPHQQVFHGHQGAIPGHSGFIVYPQQQLHPQMLQQQNIGQSASMFSHNPQAPILQPDQNGFRNYQILGQFQFPRESVEMPNKFQVFNIEPKAQPNVPSTNSHHGERSSAESTIVQILQSDNIGQTQNLSVDPEHLHTCPICQKSFSKACGLRGHMHVHIVHKNFSCDICGKAFKFQGHLDHHKIVHVEGYPYKCDLCEKGFKALKQLTKHWKQCNKERTADCNASVGKVSGYETMSTEDSRSSSDSHSLAAQPYVEPPAMDWANTPDVSQMLARYQTQVPSDERPYKCTVCGKGFMKQAHMSLHLLSHVEGHPHKCDLCGKAFKLQMHLAKHMKAHYKEQNADSNKSSGERLGSHTIEDSKSGSDTLSVYPEGSHEIKVTDGTIRPDEQPTPALEDTGAGSGEHVFECQTCGERFQEEAHLEAHVMSHDEEFPFQCYVCGKGYKRECYLTKHMNLHIKEQEEELSYFKAEESNQEEGDVIVDDSRNSRDSLSHETPLVSADGNVIKTTRDLLVLNEITCDQEERGSVDISQSIHDSLSLTKPRDSTDTNDIQMTNEHRLSN